MLRSGGQLYPVRRPGDIEHVHDGGEKVVRRHQFLFPADQAGRHLFPADPAGRPY